MMDHCWFWIRGQRIKEMKVWSHEDCNQDRAAGMNGKSLGLGINGEFGVEAMM